jgi:5-formyltetrahydrofolate cyclo-ligase
MVVIGHRASFLQEASLRVDGRASRFIPGPMAAPADFLSDTRMSPPQTPGRRALRERLIAERLALPGEAHARASAAVEAALAMRFRPESLALVGGYWPVRCEFDPLPFLRRVLASGGQVALPVVIGPRQPLDFRAWTPATRMAAGHLEIPHPAAGPALTPTLLLIPLVGFDAAGHRLGYGGGYYDRTLAAMTPRPLAVGLGFELGRLASLEPRPHDQPMDCIVTEAGLVCAREAG